MVLDKQVQEKREAREAEAAKTKNAPPERSLVDAFASQSAFKVAREPTDAPPERSILEASISESALEMARKNILEEHAREERAAAARAAYLRWRLARARLAGKRRRFLLDEMENLHEELVTSEGKPAPSLEFGTWGPVVNPFQDFARARESMRRGLAGEVAFAEEPEPETEGPHTGIGGAHGAAGMSADVELEQDTVWLDSSPAEPGALEIASEELPQYTTLLVPSPATNRAIGAAKDDVGDTACKAQQLKILAQGEEKGPQEQVAAGLNSRDIVLSSSRSYWAPHASAQEGSEEAPYIRLYGGASERDMRTPVAVQETGPAGSMSEGFAEDRDSTPDIRHGDFLEGAPDHATIARVILNAAYATAACRLAADACPTHDCASQQAQSTTGPQIKPAPAAKRPSIQLEILELDSHDDLVGMAQDIALASRTGAAPLETCVERCLVRTLREQGRLVDSNIVYHFIVEHRLVQRLQLLKRYILMGESALLEHFIVEALSRYGPDARGTQAATAPAGLEVSLNTLFNVMVPRPRDADDEQFLGLVRFTITTGHIPFGLGASRFLDAMNIELGVGPPLSMAFPSHVLSQYSRLFRLLALMHFAQHCLLSVWKNFRTRLLPTWVTALRHSMQHFTIALQRYIVVEVVSVEFASMEARLFAATSLDDIIMAHTGFLDECMVKCFQSSGAEQLLDTITSMLNQAIQLKSVIDADAAQLKSTQEAVPLLLGTIRQLRTVETAFQDLGRRLKLSGFDGDSTLKYARNEDFFEAWLADWSRRCGQ